jgi:hypothetical protein
MCSNKITGLVSKCRCRFGQESRSSGWAVWVELGPLVQGSGARQAREPVLVVVGCPLGFCCGRLRTPLPDPSRDRSVRTTAGAGRGRQMPREGCGRALHCPLGAGDARLCGSRDPDCPLPGSSLHSSVPPPACPSTSRRNVFSYRKDGRCLLQRVQSVKRIRTSPGATESLAFLLESVPSERSFFLFLSHLSAPHPSFGGH